MDTSNQKIAMKQNLRGFDHANYFLKFFILFSGSPPFIDVPVDVYPVVVTQENTNRTVLIVQAAAFTKLVIYFR